MLLITVIYLLSSVILLSSGIISIMSNAYEFNVLNCIIGLIFIGAYHRFFTEHKSLFG